MEVWGRMAQMTKITEPKKAIEKSWGKWIEGKSRLWIRMTVSAKVMRWRPIW